MIYFFWQRFSKKIDEINCFKLNEFASFIVKLFCGEAGKLNSKLIFKEIKTTWFTRILVDP